MDICWATNVSEGGFQSRPAYSVVMHQISGSVGRQL